MNKFLVAGASLALLAGTPAMAADLPLRAPPPPAVIGWTGGYFGFGVGGEWSRDRWTTNCMFINFSPAQFCNPNNVSFPLDGTRTANFHASSVRGEIHAGYQMQFGSWVLGTEIQAGLADAKGSVVGLPGCSVVGGSCLFPFQTSAGDRVSVRLLADGAWLWRGGFVVWPDLLVYATGGMALQEMRTQVSCSPNDCLGVGPAGSISNSQETFVKTGWTVGAGAEYKWGHWVARAEYRYSDFGNVTVNSFFPINGAILSPPGFGISSTLHVRTQMATVGLGWLFWTEPTPVRARY